MKLKIFFTGILSLVFSLASWCQILSPTQWSFSASKTRVNPGETIELIFKVKIDEKWYIYSNDFDPNLGPVVTSFKFKKSDEYELKGKTLAINPKEKYDDVWGGKVRYFTGKAEFRQKIKVKAGLKSISGTYEGQTCTDVDGKCIPVEGDFQFGPFEVTDSEAETGHAEKSAPQENPEAVAGINAENGDSSETQSPKAGAQKPSESKAHTKTENKTETPAPAGESVWAFFLAAFLSGLVALITPCVFPMIPMTVTFFTRQSKSRTEGIGKAGLYGLSIIVLYVLIGTLVSRLNGPEFANFISTHWAPNLFFFLVFIVFGVSFLGMFEIVLPSSLVNMADRQSDKGGIYGIFFMAFTIVLVSFSCTGPIVGSILVQSAGGQVIKPIIGMLGYSLAFALPFTLFAIFPQWLTSLPKSGGWLNSVKVVLGFLELALALKFLSIADQAYHWGILDREVYLAAWIVIFSLIGFYLLGKIHLPHDSPAEKVSVPRTVLAIVVFTFVVYMIPGMWGAPLKMLSGYLPPHNTLDFNLSAPEAESQAPNALCEPPKYKDILHLPHQLQGYFDLKQALACAAEKQKPVFIDFTGHGCVNCREMEANVWSDPEVLKRLKNDFIVTALYVDDKTELPQNQWYTSPYDGREKKTIGKQNADLQVREYKSNSQPLYVLLGPDGKILNSPRAYDLDTEAFVRFLDEGKRLAAEKGGIAGKGN